MLFGLMWLTCVVSSRAWMYGLGLLLGGILGNERELIAVGHVTDFIPFPPAGYSSPADFFLVAAAVLIGVGVPGEIASRRRARQQRPAAAP
jgi:lipoprotein signal peptidase